MSGEGFDHIVYKNERVWNRHVSQCESGKNGVTGATWGDTITGSATEQVEQCLRGQAHSSSSSSRRVSCVRYPSPPPPLCCSPNNTCLHY